MSLLLPFITMAGIQMRTSMSLAAIIMTEGMCMGTATAGTGVVVAVVGKAITAEAGDTVAVAEAGDTAVAEEDMDGSEMGKTLIEVVSGR